MSSADGRGRQARQGAGLDRAELDDDRTPREPRWHPRRIVAVAAVAVAVAAVAITVPRLVWSSARTDLSKPGGLAALTRRVPCPPSNKVVQATRRQLRAFRPVAAVTCHTTARSYRDGRWEVLVRQASSSGIADLTSAFDHPDQAPAGCAASLVAYLTAPLLLVDGNGGFLYLHYPEDRCARPARAATRAVQEHAWQTLSVRRLNQLATKSSRAAGCDLRWKNAFFIANPQGTPDSNPAPPGPVFTLHPHARLRACIYDTAGPPPASAGHVRVGRFVRGVRLTVAQSTRMRHALTGGGPAAACAPQRRFAVIKAASNDAVYVELGGCWRLQRYGPPGLGVGTADADTVKELLHLH